jgi:hypothetical protein
MADTPNSSGCSTCARNPTAGEAPLLHCSRCKNRHYCSKECQKRDWPSHKPRCSDFLATAVAPDGRSRNYAVSDAIAFFDMRKEKADFACARDKNAIFYLQIHRPYNKDLPYAILGPFEMKQAIPETNKEVLRIPNALRRSEVGTQDIVKQFASMVEDADTAPETKRMLATYKELRFQLNDGIMFRVRFHAKRNPAVTNLWSETKAGRANGGDTYFVWTSDGDYGARGRESNVERKIHATFTFARAAFDYAREVYTRRNREDGEVDETGLPITELAHLKVAGNDVGVSKGWIVEVDGNIAAPSSEEILVI